MKGFDSSFLRKHAARGAVSVLLATTTGAVGCLNRPIEPVEPRTTTTIVERLTQSSVDKIDIVLGIDNSRSMADKQEILAQAVPDLVLGLVNPNCVDDMGVVGTTPPDPQTPCGTGLKREFDPILDIHIGIVSSSIGGHGADSCPDMETGTDCGATTNYTNNDHGHLVARVDQCGGGNVPTYLDQGFLAWDPKGKLTPVGEANVMNLNTSLTNMVLGTGQIGCGYEAQLESWYRFLVDPDPFMKIELVGGFATPSPEIDLPLISQRAQFLRPDSLLAIIMLTDENDCSIKESGQNYYAGLLSDGSPDGFQLPKARAVCETNPNDPCCYSCGQQNIPPSCPADPSCVDGNGNPVFLTREQDAVNLRCWEQKRRFGIDFLYPIQRYVDALTSVQIQNRAGQVVPNPLFSDLNPMDELRNIRDPGLVFLAGIVGVPWQDIARNPNNLAEGFKDSDELAITDPNLGNKNVWDIILGDPANNVDALDPLMVESVVARTGTHPFGVPAYNPVPPTQPLGNTINGNEWTITGNNDLQYACIFPLTTPRDCSAGMLASCDCTTPGDNPLCNGTQQVRAKGYPGLRELSVLRGVTSQGIVASVCPAQTSNSAGLDYGYRPAIGAIIDRLKDALKGQCLPRTLTPDVTGQVPCLILEARNTGGMGCFCDPALARQDVTTDHAPAVKAALEDPIAKTSGWDCFCEIQQCKDVQLTACQTNISDIPVDVNGAAVNGWCYVDATTSPPLGDPLIVDECPATEKRIIRFVGTGEAQPGATLFITCSGE
jgi:hypothetical protein